MIPNEHLIRAVLDGNQVEYRYKKNDAAEWGVFESQAVAVSALAVYNTDNFEFRLKPEAKKVWFFFLDNGESYSHPSRETAARDACYYNIKKLYRVEIDATTGEPLGVFV